MKTHKFELCSLDKVETRIMIKFLESEKKRHAQDIIDINEKIAWMRKKWNNEL